jgi:hypothetical protein
MKKAFFGLIALLVLSLALGACVRSAPVEMSVTPSIEDTTNEEAEADEEEADAEEEADDEEADEEEADAEDEADEEEADTEDEADEEEADTEDEADEEEADTEDEADEEEADTEDEADEEEADTEDEADEEEADTEDEADAEDEEDGVYPVKYHTPRMLFKHYVPQNQVYYSGRISDGKLWAYPYPRPTGPKPFYEVGEDGRIDLETNVPPSTIKIDPAPNVPDPF